MKYLWKGHYVQCGKSFPMEFQQVEITDNGSIVGKGTDQVGNFEIKGSAMGNPESAKLRFVKKYIGKHQIFYEGICNKGTITGKWGFDQNLSQQDFKIEMKPK